MSLLRGFAFNLYLTILTLTMGLAAFPIRFSNKENAALSYAKLWARAVLWGLQHLCQIKIVIKGQENLLQGPMIIASQHQSFFDGFIWMNKLSLPTYIIKKELTSIPFVGPMLILSGMIAVDRQGGSQALRDMMDASHKAQKEGKQIIIFPEGTRTKPGERVKIQNGVIALARQAQAPIIPVATNSGICWPKSPWRKYPGTIIVALGQPIPAGKGRELIQNLENSWDELCATYHLPRDII